MSYESFSSTIEKIYAVEEVASITVWYCTTDTHTYSHLRALAPLPKKENAKVKDLCIESERE